MNVLAAVAKGAWLEAYDTLEEHKERCDGCSGCARLIKREADAFFDYYTAEGSDVGDYLSSSRSIYSE